MTKEIKQLNIYTKLCNAKKQFGTIIKDKKAYGYKYTDLGSVLSTIEIPLWENKLDIIQKLDNTLLTTSIVDLETGELLEMCRCEIVAAELKGTNAVQNWGAGVTYMKRYQLLTAFSLAPEDDDGKSANNTVKSNSPEEKLINEIKELIKIKSAALSMQPEHKAKLDEHVKTNFVNLDFDGLAKTKKYLSGL